MKLLKLALCATVLTLSQFATAASFTGLAGELTLSGSIFVDNDHAGDGSFSHAAGVGNITEIHDASGALVWNNSANDLSLTFKNFNRVVLQTGLSGTTQFATIGGEVSFYDNASGVFSVSGDYGTDSANIAGGNHLLSLVGLANEFGYTAVGQFSDIAYSSNGQLEVDGGSFANIFDNNAFTFGNELADMTFNITGDTVANGGYDFSGAGSAATVATVPTPGPLMLMGTGLVGLGVVRRSKNTKV